MPSFGILKADTLTHSTAGSLATNYVVNGSAKSWANFTGSGTVSARDSLNISSFTDNAVGDYTTTFSSAMNNSDYVNSSVANCENDKDRGPYALGIRIDSGGVPTTHTTTASRYEFLYGSSGSSNGGTQDMPHLYVTVHGDLA